MVARKVTFYLFAMVCLILSGCNLHDASERGEICPPGNIKMNGKYKYISLSNINCYSDKIEIPKELLKYHAICTECNDEADARGFMTCSGDITECFPELKQEYGHCLHYRKHGILDAGDKEPLRVEFYWNVEDDAPTGSLDGEDLGARSCPAEYPVCIYHEDFKSTIRKDDIPGAYGCTELCNTPKLHCGDGDDRKCINPYTSNEFCGAKGSCSGENEHGEHYRGDACAIDGKQCIDGTCSDCRIGEALCDDGKCADLKRSVEHCGSCGNACAAGEICVNGVCAVDKCPENDHVCSPANADCAESQNSSEACGKSCIDCTKLPNVAEAECRPNGACHILRCKENYYIYRDDANGIEQCRMTTNSMCAPQDGTQADIRNCLSQFAHGVGECIDGECVLTQCDPGYVVSDDGGACVEPGCEGCSSETERCFQGRCLCAEGYANCGKTAGCVNLMDDSDHCGGCHHSCEDALNVSSMDGYVDHACQKAECVITECDIGYHIHDNRKACEANTIDNCGATGHDCWQIENVADVKCNEMTGMCEIGECDSHFHAYEETCEPDTTAHCGSHEKTCHIEGSNDVQCFWDENDKAYCVTETCQDGYHLHENTCELDDNENCGSHGNKCPLNTECAPVDGQYICKCNDEIFDLCGEVCVDLKTDKNHCGGCGNTCPNNQTCSNSQCGCYDGLDNCTGICINTKANDKNNCGSCSNVCPNNQTCSNGVCGCYGLANCGGNCVDIHGSDKNNCGNCNSVCPSNQICSTGKCGCNPGLTNCGGTCFNTQTEKNHCGSCNLTCPNNQVCDTGKCGCASGLTNCSGTCFNTQTDVNNCGVCGTKCNVANANNSCSGGKCNFTCNSGYIKSGNGCVKHVCTEGATKCNGTGYNVCQNNTWVTKPGANKSLTVSIPTLVYSTLGGSPTRILAYTDKVTAHTVALYGGIDYVKISSPINGWAIASGINLHGTATVTARSYYNETTTIPFDNIYITAGTRYFLGCQCPRWSTSHGWGEPGWFTNVAPDLSGIPRCNP